MPRERRAVVASYFLVFCGAGVGLPYFPLYLSHLGYRGWQIGVLLGMQPALRWGAALACAYAADHWRVRHRLLVLTALAGTAFFVPLLFVRDFVAVLVVIGAIGLLHGPLIPLLDATVVDHLPQLGGDYGRLRLWGSIGFVVGALGSAPLIHAYSPAIIPLLLLLSALGLAPVLARLPRAQQGLASAVQAPWTLLTPPLTAFLATVFLIQLSSGAWVGFFAVHTAALGFSDAAPGLAWGLGASAEIVLLFWGRRIVGWLAPPELIVAALALTVVRWGCTALARTQVVVVGLQVGHAFTFSTFHLAAVLLLARLVPPQSSTGGQALYGLVGIGVAGSVGVGVAGLLVDRLGTSGVFGVEAVVALLALWPALRLRRLVAAAPPHPGANFCL